MARKPPKGKSLAELNPELAKQWHSTKNGDLTPFDVSSGSDKKVWWKCNKVADHEWKSNIYSRKSGSGCPACSILMSRGSRKPKKGKSLAEVNPELIPQWHPTKNADLTPFDFSYGTNKEVWWKCPEGDDHEWEGSIKKRAGGGGCPICCNQMIVISNCLSTTNSQLAKEWHPTKNGDLTPYMVSEGANKKVWWKCFKDDHHEWEAKIFHRKNGTGCPICAGKIVVKSNSLAILFPNLAKEWHPTKNGNLTTYDVSTGSEKKVWWKCNKGNDHEWESRINNRKNGKGCPICDNKKIVISNSLATTLPNLAKEWHPIKNGALTPTDVSSGSNKRIWWKCNKGDDHEWHTPIKRRKETGCPFCTLTPQSKQELTITFELIQFFKDINPKGFKTRVKGKLWSIDIYIPQLTLGIEFDEIIGIKINEL